MVVMTRYKWSFTVHAALSAYMPTASYRYLLADVVKNCASPFPNSLNSMASDRTQPTFTAAAALSTGIAARVSILDGLNHGAGTPNW